MRRPGLALVLSVLVISVWTRYVCHPAGGPSIAKPAVIDLRTEHSAILDRGVDSNRPLVMVDLLPGLLRKRVEDSRINASKMHFVARRDPLNVDLLPPVIVVVEPVFRRIRQPELLAFFNPLRVFGLQDGIHEEDLRWRPATVSNHELSAVRSARRYQEKWTLRSNHELSLFEASCCGALSCDRRLTGFHSLPGNDETGSDDCPSRYSFRPTKEYVPPWQVGVSVLSFFIAGLYLFRCNHRGRAILGAVGYIFLGGAMLLVGHERYPDYEREYHSYPAPCFTQPQKPTT